MGLLSKVKTEVKQEEPNLSQQELEFLLIKMRSADYKGEEFEMFYKIYLKLAKELETLKSK